MSEEFLDPDASKNTVYIEEKLDGANFRFGKIHGTFRVGSRRVDLTQYIEKINREYPPHSDVKKEAGLFKKAILHALEYYNALKPNYEYIVEYMIPHTLDYHWERMPLFIGLDIYDIDQKQFLNWEEKVAEFKRLGIPNAPLVMKTTIGDIAEKDPITLIPRSRYRDGWAEGVVIKDYKRQWFVKAVRPEFREENKKVWGIGSKKAAKKYAKDGSEWFVEAFITKRRIEKIIEKLVDEGKPVGMELMQWLPREVLMDAWEEHWADVAMENVVIDTRKIRKLTANRCRRILEIWLERKKKLSEIAQHGHGQRNK